MIANVSAVFYAEADLIKTSAVVPTAFIQPAGPIILLARRDRDCDPVSQE